MKRPADCLDDARALLAAREDAHPSLIAEGDQFDAQARDTLAGLREGTSLHHVRAEGPDAVAFLMAAQVALFERLAEYQTGGMCPHMVDPNVPQIIDLHHGFVSCRACAPILQTALDAWSEELCDVCGDPSPGDYFAQVSFTLGVGVAFANVCSSCSSYIGMEAG